MKSSQQRRLELKVERQARRDKEAAKVGRADDDCRERRRVLVIITKLAPDNSYGVPDFVSRGYYQDLPFTCCECGKNEVWTATQQKWWYEVAKGKVWTTARRCRPCRQRESRRRTEARRVHLEGNAPQALHDSTHGDRSDSPTAE